MQEIQAKALIKSDRSYFADLFALFQFSSYLFGLLLAFWDNFPQIKATLSQFEWDTTVRLFWSVHKTSTLWSSQQPEEPLDENSRTSEEGRKSSFSKGKPTETENLLQPESSIKDGGSFDNPQQHVRQPLSPIENFSS